MNAGADNVNFPRAVRLWRILNILGRHNFQRRLIRRRLIFFSLGSLVIIAWQMTNFSLRSELSTDYKNSAAVALTSEHKFLYFLYYENLFPIATTEENLDFSREGARELLQTRGDSLQTELDSTIRWGDLGQTYLYLPYAIMKGSPEHFDLRPTCGALFILSLLFVFGTFLLHHRPLTGCCLVVLFGSNPFQLYEAYAHNNVFSLNISLFLFLLALNFSLLVTKTRLRTMLIKCLASSVLIAIFVQFRSDLKTLILVVGLCIIFCRGASRLQRAGGLIVLVLAYSMTIYALQGYFNQKIEDAKSVVKLHGGHIYEGPIQHSHSVWHPLVLGLADVDKDFHFDDRFGHHVVMDLLERDSGVKLPEYSDTEWGFVDYYHDEAKRFRVEPPQLPGYNEWMKGIFINFVFDNPFKYFKGLTLRIGRVIKNVTPAGLAIGSFSLSSKLVWLLSIPVLLIVAVQRQWPQVVLMLSTLALSATALMIYSGRGLTYYGCMHLVATALVVSWIMDYRTLKRRSKAWSN